jgi:hypothetical protein
LSWSLLIRRPQRAHCQAETPLIVLCRFPRPALGTEDARPVASFVRLKPLHLCDMIEAEADESEFFALRKFLWRVVNRKLRILLGVAGVEERKFVDEVVQRGTQVVANLTNENRDHGIRFWGQRWVPDAGTIRRIGIKANRSGIKIILPEQTDMPLQVRKVFLCPINPLKSAVEWMRRNHAKVVV